jgi:hypothetical protein
MSINIQTNVIIIEYNVFYREKWSGRVLNVYCNKV